MPARPISSATVSFGLVSVPVSLYSSSESKASVSFNMMHEDCGTKLKQQYICPKHETVVERDAVVKGYEFAKGKYVLFNKEELKALEQQKSESIEITEFVPADQVDRLQVDKVYYMGPDRGGDRAYRLLSRALRDTRLCAIAKYAARGKMYLVMIRPMGEGLAMEQLKYADEIRPFAEVPLGEGQVKDEELALAIQFIKQSARDAFDPAKYEDEVRQRTLELIQKKIDGEDITTVEPLETGAKILDLMEALKASLAQAPEPEADAQPKKRKAGGKR
jgi:DNA end-binding protein Ku